MSDEQGNHYWTAEEMQARGLWPDETLRDLKHYDNPIVTAAFNFLAQNEISKPNSLLKQMPQLRLMTEKVRESAAAAGATLTQSGTPYILIHPAVVRPGAYTDQEVLSALTHELGHLAKGHTTFQGLADLSNGVDVMPLEKEADRYAIAQCQGQGLLSLLERARAQKVAYFEQNIANPGDSFEDWQREQQPSHPTMSEAIDTIQSEMQLATHCNVKPRNGNSR